ncbi:hypothetical protein C2845_PM13G23220 [Panicum miliaceum]|uniref:Jacalin-type lectin domain-containing protein n=1 Tax=Panicum miliaceum TaxID=4540 RepID=A0A3L6RLI8_PANMI|nr:hypothetical protein C2845_PM13G23220 [Panicum miliaceum]
MRWPSLAAAERWAVAVQRSGCEPDGHGLLPASSTIWRRTSGVSVAPDTGKAFVSTWMPQIGWKMYSIKSVAQTVRQMAFHGANVERAMGSVVRMGPCGGGGGGARDVDTRGVDRVARVAVRHGDAVHAVSVLYERGRRQEWTDLWGGPGGELAEICLRPGEHLTSVEGHCGEFEGSFVVRALTLVSNRRAYGPYGRPGPDGVPFALPAAGGRILGFHARSGRHLDAIGTYVMVEQRQPR